MENAPFEVLGVDKGLNRGHCNERIPCKRHIGYCKLAWVFVVFNKLGVSSLYEVFEEIVDTFWDLDAEHGRLKMTEVVFGELSRISSQFVTRYAVKHILDVLEFVASDNVLSSSIAIKVRGSWQIVLFVKSYSVLVISENVSVDVRDGCKKLAKIADILSQGYGNIVSETVPTRLHVDETLELW